jgi:hypothetical protein
MPAGRRSAQLGTLLATLLLAAGCGATEPEPLEAIEPEVPADLCASVPEAARAGLIASSSSDETGHPTAACSLRSPDDAKAQVQAVVTWVQATDDVSADAVWDSQCRAIDRTVFRVQNGFQAKGADEACAASGTVSGADSATLAAVTEREVVTVRVSSKPVGAAPAAVRGQQVLEGVLGSLAGSS